MNIKNRPTVIQSIDLSIGQFVEGRFFCYNINAGGLYKRYLVPHFTRHFLFGII